MKFRPSEPNMRDKKAGKQCCRCGNFLSFLVLLSATAFTFFHLGEKGKQQEKQEPKMPLFGRRAQIVLFGDSITEQSFRPGGWGAALADTYSRKADLIVRGYGGYNTRWALQLLDRVFLPDCPTPPIAVTIFFGANDAALLGRNNERQHVPIEEYENNLRKIVNHLKTCFPDVLVVLITPPPIDEHGRKTYARSVYGDKAMEHPERTNEMAGIYAGHCAELAKELHLPCINLWTQMQEVVGWQKKFLSDGLHLTEEGNAVVHKEVVKVLEEAGFLAEDMEYDFPHHSWIDSKKPDLSNFQART